MTCSITEISTPYNSCIAVRHDCTTLSSRAIGAAAVVAVAVVAFVIAVVAVAERSFVQYNRSCTLHGKSSRPAMR
jgi:hypothetical protein